MDTSLLGLEEHFSTYYVEPESDDHSSLGDNNKDYFNEWEDETELNGDIALIPECSGFCESLKDFTDSPPSLLFQNMMDWSVFAYVEGIDNVPHEDDHDLSKSSIDIKDFDLTHYIEGTDEEKPPPRQIKSVGKKIDKAAQKYIIEKVDDEIDVETVEGASLPVLEANDALSLLEQFEASEKPISAQKPFGFTFEQTTSPIEILEKVPSTPDEIFENEKKENTNKRQILDALPQELIARINESGKRKAITVIPPIPTKKRNAPRSIDVTHKNKIAKPTEIQLDHNYCAVSQVYPKEPRKDSGFQSEEDDRAVIRNQPMVKTADGKLMVSLLKVNTIRINEKKKLNLEEYKKRRFISSNTTSQSSSPISSTCSSPLPEDENQRRIKHQQKLMRMATELLNTPAKSSNSKPIMVPVETVVVKQIVPPPDLEVKTYVSIGTNTDISSIDTTKSLIELEEIKPLLKSEKINSNSFITSLIENIPKVKTKNTFIKSEDQEVVREDKIIHYLKKDREPVKVFAVGVQTDFEEESRYRRRIERSLSVSSNEGRQKRSRSNSSSSSSSSSSKSSRSRSRSISPKRQRQYNAERLREVEERRVIYVGRIVKGTTRDELRRRFASFGSITNVSLHFREYGDNYGFVTFANKEDAYQAVEHGNDHGYPKYDLSFGGRRIFCQTTYADLDNMREDDFNHYPPRSQDNSFDALLRAAQDKIRKRKP